MRDLLRALMAAAIMFVLSACQAGQAPHTGQPREPALPAATAATPSPIPSPACDPTDELLAAMFVGLSDAALANAGIAPDAFLTSLANRATLDLYLEALDIAVDEKWIDAAMSASLGQRLLKETLEDRGNPPTEDDWLVCES